tara:strand:+ start:751 stop:1185 length:435 start_codon:yes stop_codon:yes gene_type:complete
MSNIRDFPNIKPASRSYTPGSYPQVEFVAQNGAKTVLRYGNKKVDAKLSLGFTNITDSQANEILNLYEEVNSDYDFINFPSSSALVGVADPPSLTSTLQDKMAEKDSSGNTLLRYRFDGPPTVTSVKPGRSNVQCKFVACLDGD